jgi:hypothetical protein
LLDMALQGLVLAVARGERYLRLTGTTGPTEQPPQDVEDA